MTRRNLLPALAAGLSGCSRRPDAAGCQASPGQPIRWIVPYPPGGGYDVLSRLFEKPFEKATGAEVVIGNEPGGGGVLGARKIADARPDGRTLGVLNSTGLIAAALAGQSVPNPARDFTILGRLNRTRPILVTSRESPLRTIEDVIARSTTKPLLFAITGPTSNNFALVVAAASLLGLRHEIVAGYGGSREELLAVMRGEVDLLSGNFESLQSSLESGDLRPLLQAGPADGTIAGIPGLAGPGGWAARRAAETGREPAAAIAEADDLFAAMSSGTLVTAPKALPPAIATCLRAQFSTAATDPGFLNAARTARRTLEILDGEAAQQEALRAEQRLQRFAPLVLAAVKRLRR
jgi:tripartite-type tricarboxylate transporter receptor subunit TctC